jgi:hypothetical protein
MSAKQKCPCTGDNGTAHGQRGLRTGYFFKPVETKSNEIRGIRMPAFDEQITGTGQHAPAGFPGQKTGCRFYFSGNNAGFVLKRAHSATSCGDTSFSDLVFTL